MAHFPGVQVLPCGSQGLRLSKQGLGCMGEAADGTTMLHQSHQEHCSRPE